MQTIYWTWNFIYGNDNIGLLLQPDQMPRRIDDSEIMHNVFIWRPHTHTHEIVITAF